jgi:RNA polymerase sigma-70 factor (ECF subfamily)
LALYDWLMIIAPTPIVALNRCVALAETEGPETALRQLDELELSGYHLYHATRADLLRRLDRRAEAATAYDAAITQTTNGAERAFLVSQRQTVL